MSCIFRGRAAQHFGDIHCHLTWQAQHFRRVALPVFFANTNVGAASSGDNVKNAILYNPHFALFTLHFTLYTTHSTLYTHDSTLHTLHSTLYTVHSTLHTPHFTLYTLHFTLHTPHFTHSTLPTPHFTLHTPYFTQSLHKLLPSTKSTSATKSPAQRNHH